jgi:uncharacterized protein YndB with AHSA1/START domain
MTRPDDAAPVALSTRARVSSTPEHHELHLTRVFPHPVERVWRAITDPALLSRWWPMRTADVPLAVGAPVVFTDEAGGESHGVVTDYETARVLGFTDDGGAHAVRFTLHPHPAGCRLEFSHRFAPADPPAQHATGWHLCFEALAALLDGRPVPPLGYDPAVRAAFDAQLAGAR